MLPSYQSSVYVSLCSPCCLTLSHLSAHVVLAQIGYLVKSLDQGNINNAFLSGMKEDLFVSHSLSVFIQRLSRLLHQRNVWKSTCTCRNLLCMSRRLWLPAFPSSAPPPPSNVKTYSTFLVKNAGYIIGQLPLTLLLTRLPVRWVIPGIELFVGIFTLAAYAIKTVVSLSSLLSGVKHCFNRALHTLASTLRRSVFAGFFEVPFPLKIVPGSSLTSFSAKKGRLLPCCAYRFVF